MVLGYWRTQGKIPIGKENQRTLYQTPPEGDYCAVYDDSIVSIDIDDFDHKTGEVVNPVRGKPRSEAVIAFLEEHGVKYNGIRTEYGVHLDFRKPSDFKIESNKNGWYCPLGVEIEVKVTKVVELVVVNGVKRQCFKGSFTNENIDELPSALFPLQKSQNKPFDMNFEAGNRNNRLSEYAFYLTNQGIQADDVRKIIIGLNDFILEEPLPEDEIELILREDTMEKLHKAQQERQERNLSHVTVGNEVIEQFSPVTVDDIVYGYKNGVYVEIKEGELLAFMTRKHPSSKTSLKNEALAFLKAITYRDYISESNDFINVKNGLLEISLDGTVTLKPHDKNYVSFRQFNVLYNPEARSEILRITLDKFFNGDTDLIELFKQMMGYLLMNHTDYQKSFFFMGLPSSGKSKILNIISEFCGRQNVSNLTLKDLDHNFRLSGIVGKIASINADLEKAVMTSSGSYKALVTGDGLTMERKHGKPFSYVSTAKLIYASNQFPDFSRDAEGIQRRIIIFPCNHVFSKDDPDFDPTIGLKLKTEEALSDLLNLAIEGYLSLLANDGFISTKATETASEAFKRDTDSVYSWISETDDMPDRLTRDPIKNGFDGLYPEYQKYCFDMGEEPKKQRDFTKTICQEFGLEPYEKRFDKKLLRFYRKK